MRTTLDIDDDVLVAVKERAAAEKTTTGRVLSELARQALTHPAAEPLIKRNGFYVLPPRGGVVTSALVRRLEHQADLEDAGILPED